MFVCFVLFFTVCYLNFYRLTIQACAMWASIYTLAQALQMFGVGLTAGVTG